MAEEFTRQPDNDKEEILRWQSRTQTERKRLEDIAKKKGWERLIDEYKGIWAEADGRFDIDVLPLNLIFAFIKTEIPALYIRDPHIKINPKNKTSIATAKVLEKVINYLWKYKKLKREIKKSIVDGLLIGHSWFKTGYTGEFGTIEDNKGATLETVEKEDFFAYRVPWKDVVFDPDSIDPPYDCKWIAHSIWLSTDELKRNPRYKNTDQLRMSEEAGIGQRNDMGVEDRNRQKIRVDEVWDIENKKVFTITEGIDEYLEEPKEWPYDMRGYPFSFLKFNFTNDEPFGVSDTSMFEPQVVELMKLRSMMLDHLKRFNRQYQADESISEDELSQLTKGITGSVIKGDMSKGDIVKAIQYPPLQTDAYAIEERLKEDAINISGQSPQERGGTQKTTTRAFRELLLISEGAKNRRSEKVDLVEEFIEDIATNWVGLIKQFATIPIYVRILGQQSPELQRAIQERPSAQGQEAVTSEQGFTFTKDDVEGEYDVETVAGSSTPIDRAQKVDILLRVVELLPQIGIQGNSPLFAAIGKMFSEELDMPELEQAIEQEIQRQIQVQQQQAKEAEELKQLQLAQEGSKTQLEAEKLATGQNKNFLELLKTELERERLILEKEQGDKQIGAVR